MKKHLYLALLSVAILSCSSAKSHPDEHYFSFTDRTDAPYFTRNGDNYGKKGIAYSYQEVTRTLSTDAVIDEINHGKSIFLLLHAEGCSGCSAAHDDLVSFFLESGLEVYGGYFALNDIATTAKELERLVNCFPEYARYLSAPYYTPTIYLLDSPTKMRPVSFQDERKSLQNLEEFFKELMNFTMVYTFKTFASFQTFAKENDCLVYRNLYSQDYFYESIYPLAKHSAKHTAYLDYASFSEDDKRLCDELFQGDYEIGAVKKGVFSPLFEIDKSPEEAERFVKEYYGV